MSPILIGYFPKRTSRETTWVQNPLVEEIASVSCCMSKEPEDWINLWLHNELFVFDTCDLAISVVPHDQCDVFDVYAYALFPLQFVRGEQEDFDLPRMNVQPLPENFEQLGYDLVSRSCESAFECSPLSCNCLASEVKVNRYCLLDDAQTALSLPKQVDLDRCEPGPYFVAEVWRRVRATHAPTSGSTVP